MGNPYVWTGTEAIIALRDTIGDPVSASTPRWADADLARYINRGAQQVILATEYTVETQWEVTTVAATREYELPTNFVRDEAVEYVKSTTDIRRLEYLTFEEYFKTFSNNPTSAGDPIYYFFWRKLGDTPEPIVIQPSSLYLHPVPTEAKVVRVWGYKLPDAILSTDLSRVIEFEGPYVEAVISYAGHLAMMDDGDTAKADRLEVKYERLVSKIMDYNSHKTRSERGRITPRQSVLNNWAGRKTMMPWHRGLG